METYTMDKINPKYRDAVKRVLEQAGKTENDEFTDYELMFCGESVLHPDFFVTEA